MQDDRGKSLSGHFQAEGIAESTKAIPACTANCERWTLVELASPVRVWPAQHTSTILHTGLAQISIAHPRLEVLQQKCQRLCTILLAILHAALRYTSVPQSPRLLGPGTPTQQAIRIMNDHAFQALHVSRMRLHACFCRGLAIFVHKSHPSPQFWGRGWTCAPCHPDIQVRLHDQRHG